MRSRELVTGAFNAKAGLWQERDPGREELRLDRLTVATFNVWFGMYMAGARRRALLDILGGLEADVIGLQEVTPPLLDLVLAEPWVRERYWVSDVTGTTVEEYGNLLLSRLPAERVMLHDFDSEMGRRLLAADFRINGGLVRVGTVHLESMAGNESYRRGQLKRSFGLLADAPTAVLMGDFNLCATWDENGNLDPAYADVWPAVHPGDPGWTQDSELNRMRPAIGANDRKVRFDRVILRSGAWRPAAIRRLGTNPVAPDKPDVFPSDHFGLFATFTPV